MIHVSSAKEGQSAGRSSPRMDAGGDGGGGAAARASKFCYRGSTAGEAVQMKLVQVSAALISVENLLMDIKSFQANKLITVLTAINFLHREEADGFSVVNHDETPWHGTSVLLKMR